MKQITNIMNAKIEIKLDDRNVEYYEVIKYENNKPVDTFITQMEKWAITKFKQDIVDNTNEEKLDAITKLISQASYIKKQMTYGSNDFKMLHKILYQKSAIALWIMDTLKGIRAVNKADKIIDSLHNIKIK